MNELIFVNKDTNVRFMVSRSQQLVVPQIGAKIFLQDPNDVTYQEQYIWYIIITAKVMGNI